MLVFKKIILRSLLCSFLLLYTVCAYSADYLFNNKRTSYRIVVAANASVTERKAAKELSEYLKQISGAVFELTNTPGHKNIYIGYDENFPVFNGLEPYQCDSDGFVVKKIGHDLIIFGGRTRGTMFGVYRFLSKYLGVWWYTPEYTKIPKMRKYFLRQIDFSENPNIKYRYTDFFCSQDIPWLAHNTMNTIRDIKKNEYGLEVRYYGVHSLAKLLPASNYFKVHPEYFAYRNGQRIEQGQPCLSNPEVKAIVTKEILSVIERNPGYSVYDVSQIDNQNYCTCELCTKLETKYGGHSGLMIWFVNEVAREVKKKYPDKYIGTFAYQYTRHAPTNIKPDDNVIVRLCDIECCFAHPLASECNDKNNAFMEDLQCWSKLTSNLYIWDYIVNYSNYMAPFPNIHVLGPNLKTFSEYGAIEVFEEAQSGTLGNAFEELKTWVLTQLMWNPDQDTDELVAQFVNDYYGDASDDILDYYYLCLSLVNENTHFGCFTDPQKAPFTDEFNDEAYKILEKALSHADNDIIYERVQKVLLQPMALECARHPIDFYRKGKWPVFKCQLLKLKSCFQLGVSPELFIKTFESNLN